MAIIPKQENETNLPAADLVSVTEFDISDSLGTVFPYSYQESFQIFRELLNDPENGIPADIRKKLAEIYTETGRSLSENHIAFRAVYTIGDIEDEIDQILTDDYGLPEEKLDEVKKAAQIDTQKMREFLIGAVTSVDDSSAVGEIVSEVFSQSVSDDLATHLNIKIEEGMLPMLESIDGDDFDMS